MSPEETGVLTFFQGRYACCFRVLAMTMPEDALQQATALIDGEYAVLMTVLRCNMNEVSRHTHFQTAAHVIIAIPDKMEYNRR